TFGSELDRASQAQIERGQRVVEVLKQLQYEPLSVEQQVLVIFAVTQGFMDDVAVSDVKRFELEFRAFVEARHADVGQAVREKGTLPDALVERLREAIGEFRRIFVPSEGQPPLKEAGAEPLTEEQQEALKKFRRPTPEEVQAKAGPLGTAE